MDQTSNIADTLNLWFWTIDSNGRFTYSNSVSIQLLGYTPEEITELTIYHLLDLPSSGSMPALTDIFGARTETESLLFSHNLISKQGNPVPVIFLVKAGKNTNGYSGTCYPGQKNSTHTELEDNLQQVQIDLKETQRIGKIGNWHVDVKSSKVIWSEELYRMLDLDPSTPAPDIDDHQNLLTPESWAIFKPAIQNVYENGEPYELTLEFVTKSGRKVWVLGRGEGKKDEAGNIVHLQGTAIDISEYKRLEMSLTNTVHVLEETQRIGMIGSWNLELASGHINWSEQLYKMFERSDSNPPPDLQESSSLFTPESWDRLESAIGHTAATGEPYAQELEFITENGRHGWMMARGEAKLNEAGDIVQINGMAIDITKSKRLEMNLTRTVHDLVETQRIGKLGTWNVDLLSGHVNWSEQLYRMFERDPATPPPKYTESSEFFTPESWNRLETSMAHSAETGEPFDQELEFITENGRHGWTIIRGEARKDYAGRIVRLQGTTIDITSQKEIEIQLANSLNRSEQTLQETVELIVNLNHMRDPYTAGHEWRVAALSSAIANKLGLPEFQKTGLVIAAKLHDIGNVIVSEDILGRTGIISQIELNKIKLHASAGSTLLEKVSFPWPVATAVLQHHERLDGTGYPDGLKGKDIILESRIIAVADMVEAMSSPRPNRPSRHIEFVLQEIIKDRGTALDAEVVDACVSLFRDDGYTIPEYKQPNPLR